MANRKGSWLLWTNDQLLVLTSESFILIQLWYLQNKKTMSTRELRFPFSTHVYLPSLLKWLLGKIHLNVPPETSVNEKWDRANLENNLQDQSTKPYDIVVSVTTSALKDTPLQQEVWGNKGTKSLSLPSYMPMILEEGAYVKYIYVNQHPNIQHCQDNALLRKVRLWMSSKGYAKLHGHGELI